MKKTVNFNGWSDREEILTPPLKTSSARKGSFYSQPEWKRRVIFFFWLPILILFCTGCISLYYAPNSQNVPMFKEKNETEASLAFQIGTLTFGWDANLAYSVTNHLGLMVNYNHWSKSSSDAEMELLGKGNQIELGAGYFLPFHDKFVFEAYGGGGWGGVKNEYGSFLESKVNYNRYFIQPSCGYYNKNVNLIFSLRLSGIDYNRIKFDPDIEESDKYDLEYIIDYPFSFYIEPAFTFRVGSEKFKWQVQIVYSDNLNTPELTYEPLCITTGLIVLFPNKKDQTDKPIN